MRLWFLETQWFTRRVDKLGLEEDLRGLQEELLLNPEAGAVDAGTGGLRKVRMSAAARGCGNRGGARVHYLWLPAHSVVYLLFVYGKDERDTLDDTQKKALKRVVEHVRDEWNRRRR